MQKTTLILPEVIENKILLLRGKRVILDSDLAYLYGVETKQLKRAVNRNNDRFPPDFMLTLTKAETDFLRCQIGTLENETMSDKRGRHVKYLPYAFTEQGVAMLSSVLHSKRAIHVNIQIMRTFTKLRKIILTHKDLQIKIEQLIRQQEKQHGKLLKHDQQISVIFDAIKQLLEKPAEPEPPKKKWGFVPNNERDR